MLLLFNKVVFLPYRCEISTLFHRQQHGMLY